LRPILYGTIYARELRVNILLDYCSSREKQNSHIPLDFMDLKLKRENKEIINLFYNLSSNSDIANLLEVNLNTLIFFVYRLADSDRYKEFKINKKAGGTRTIKSPTTGLKILQQKLNQVLQLVYKPPYSAFGFIENKNIKKNAKNHIHKKYILSLDLKNFFDSIHFGRIRGLFMASPYKFNKKVATTLSNLCCYKSKLPQGAPTSPIISNMIARKLDGGLSSFAKEYNIRYSRYADDITFSSEINNIQLFGEYKKKGEFAIRSELKKIITENKFELNEKKNHIVKDNQRQLVTGLVVNEKVNIPRNYYRQIRSLLYLWYKFGLKVAEKEYYSKWDKKNKPPFKNAKSLEHTICGKINYLKDIKGKQDTSYIALHKKFEILKARERYLNAKKDLNRQGAGYLLQNILKSLFDINEIYCKKPFMRREGSDQIDGAFILDTNYYLVECKWKKEINKGDVGSFTQDLDVSPGGTLGLFLSINGWPINTEKNLRESRSKSVILMDGEDLEYVLEGKIGLKKLLEKKIEAFKFKSMPFYSVKEILKHK